MTDWIWTKTAALANVWGFLVVFAVALFFSYVLFPRHARNYPTKTENGKTTRVGTLDGQFAGYSPSDVEPKFKELGDDGVDAYFSQEWKLDLIFPWVYALLFAIPIVWIGQNTTVPRSLVLFPFLAAIFDYVENLTAMAMIRAWQKSGAVPYALKVVGSIGSRGKWICIWISLAAILWVLVLRIRRPVSV
jgi:hypothetical protein